MELLTFAKVEDDVRARVMSKAMTFGQVVSEDLENEIKLKIEPELAVELYDKWIMPLTKEVQVQYLLKRLDWVLSPNYPLPVHLQDALSLQFQFWTWIIRPLCFVLPDTALSSVLVSVVCSLVSSCNPVVESSVLSRAFGTELQLEWRLSELKSQDLSYFYGETWSCCQMLIFDLLLVSLLACQNYFSFHSLLGLCLSYLKIFTSFSSELWTAAYNSNN